MDDGNTAAVARALRTMVAGGQDALLATKLITVSMGNAVWTGLPDVEEALDHHTAAASELLDRVHDAMVDGTGCRLAARVVARLLLGAQHYRAALNRLCMPYFVSSHMGPEEVYRASMAAMTTAKPGVAVLALTLLVDDEPSRTLDVDATAARDDPAKAEEYRAQIRERAPYTHTWATVFTCGPDGAPVATVFMAYSEHYTLAGWLGLDAAADDVIAHMSPGLKPMFRRQSRRLIAACPYRGPMTAPKYTAFMNDVATVGGTGRIGGHWIEAYRRAFAVDMATLERKNIGVAAKRFSFHTEAFKVDALPAAVAEVKRVESEME